MSQVRVKSAWATENFKFQIYLLPGYQTHILFIVTLNVIHLIINLNFLDNKRLKYINTLRVILNYKYSIKNV